jgi:hypothetical protein
MAVVLMHGGDNCSDGDDGNSGDSDILKLIAMVMIMLPNFNKNSLKKFYL